MTTSESQTRRPTGPAELLRVQPQKAHTMEANTTPIAEETVRIIPSKPAALTLSQLDEIRTAAIAYADACRAHQQYVDSGSDHAGAAAVNATLDALNRLLDQATTTSVDTALLERTLERDALTVERDALLVRNADLAIEREGREARLREITADRDRLVRSRGINSAATEELKARTNRAEEQLEKFREQVQEVAYRYAEEHGWCEVIDDAMRELGLERQPVTYRGQITITVDFRATLADRRQLPAESWVLDSLDDLQGIRNAVREAIDFDSDHDSSEITGVEIDVTDVRDDD